MQIWYLSSDANLVFIALSSDANLVFIALSSDAILVFIALSSDANLVFIALSSDASCGGDKGVLEENTFCKNSANWSIMSALLVAIVCFRRGRWVRGFVDIKIQSNLDYSKCQGPQESFRIIGSSNDRNRKFSDIFGKARCFHRTSLFCQSLHLQLLFSVK